jgi:hypothetical protein
MRRRGNISIEHEKQGQPPILTFKYEMVVDGRTLEQPANYALVRVIPPVEYPTDPAKRPFVVIDPRAGHGPGIGGSKIDSEIGIALRSGYHCYFIFFFPKPCKGQTIESVARAESVFSMPASSKNFLLKKACVRNSLSLWRNLKTRSRT